MASVLLMLQTVVNSYSISERSEIRGTWLTNIDSDILFSSSALKAGINRLERLNFNTLYPTVWQGGYSLYPSQITEAVYGERVYPISGLESRDMLAEVVTKGHEARMRVIPWFEFGFMAPANSALARQNPDWLTQRQDGTQIEVKGEDEVVWLNPFHPEVQEFILDLVTEIVENYDVDGIQFDDHLALPVEFGYDDYTRQLYEREMNLSPPKDARETFWVRWRADQLNQFMGKLFHTIKATNPDCLVSVSPNPLHFSLPSSLQDWFTWERKGYIEELVLQIYHRDWERLIAELERTEVELAKAHIPVAVGILSGLKDNPTPIEMVSEQVKAVRDRDFAGVSFFFYESLWHWGEKSPQEREEIISQLFQQ
ncbi:MAG: glycoside hydrolase family 10 protein [Halothece sp.]